MCVCVCFGRHADSVGGIGLCIWAGWLVADDGVGRGGYVTDTGTADEDKERKH